MKTVQAIIDLFGGLEHLKTHPIKLVVPHLMPLCIEFVGVGPRGCPLISTAMYFEQCGDLMRDPDLVCERHPAGKWMPVSFRNDALGMDHLMVWLEGDRLFEKGGLVADVEAFMVQWSIDLHVQGFLIAAQQLAGK
jgi:hypothetical protein